VARQLQWNDREAMDGLDIIRRPILMKTTGKRGKSKSGGRWTKEEHEQFLVGLRYV
jgi:hypothetical protein